MLTVWPLASAMVGETDRSTNGPEQSDRLESLAIDARRQAVDIDLDVG